MIASDAERKAKQVLAAGRKARRATRPAKTKGRVRDAKFLHWLHKGIPCIACEIEQNPTWPTVYPIEAAHQRHAKGKGGMLGRRPDDADTCCLCAWHHRLAPDACDPANRQFWARLAVDVGAFCQGLHAAFKGNSSGADVVAKYVKIARETP